MCIVFATARRRGVVSYVYVVIMCPLRHHVRHVDVELFHTYTCLLCVLYVIIRFPLRDLTDTKKGG